MKTFISSTPAEEASAYMNAALAAHAHEPLLLILSGGSSLSVAKLLHSSKLSKNTLIAMADERFTNDREGNNFYQLQRTPFYEKALERGALFIDSMPHENEDIEEFTGRLQKELDAFLTAYPTHYAIGLLGIGEDGHTAGIFPSTQTEFEKIYHVNESSDYYVHLTAPTEVFKSRVTVTPSFIEEILGEVVLYAVGENKCALIVETLHSNTHTRNQLPALIAAKHQNSVLFTDCAIEI